MARLVGWIGARVIYARIWLFGRTRRWTDIPWLAGPVGRDVIGARRRACDHAVKFLGLPVLKLHYKIFRRADAAIAA